MHRLSRFAPKAGWLMTCVALSMALAAAGQGLALTKQADVQSIPPVTLTPIGQLLAEGRKAGAGGPVRVRGSVENTQPESLFVRDPTGIIAVELHDKGDFHLGAAVEVFAYPVWRQKTLVLTRAVVSTPTTPDSALKTIERIAEIRDLSPPQAALGYPVHVCGVVTYEEEEAWLHFVQDDSAGIYFALTAAQGGALPPAGTRVELWGFSGPGEFAPVLLVEKIKVLGSGQFPNPAPIPYQLLMTGAGDSQWVALRGVIRSLKTTGGQTLMDLSIGDAVIPVKIIDNFHAPPSNLIGAAIEAKGVCRSLFDERRRFEGLGFCVPGWDKVDMKEAGLSNPFDLPRRPISELFRFSAAGYGLQRSHVTGRVVLRRNDGTLFVQDASGGIRIEPRNGPPTQDWPGNWNLSAGGEQGEAGVGGLGGDGWVEVVGFPALKDQLPILQDVIVRPLAKPGPHPSPMPLTPEMPLNEDLNATLVTLEGRAIGNASQPGEYILTVEFGQRVIDAIMEGTNQAALPRIVPGSVVQLTGVYVARLNNSRQIQTFQILLRSPSDLRVTEVPPWWTKQLACWTLGGLGAVLLLAVAWVVLLRKQVRRRTAELDAQIEEHKHTVKLLKGEIVERKRAEQKIEEAHRELVAISHQAGMAEVATSVLHNVGNVLNSVNVSSALVTQKLRTSQTANLGRVVALLNAHSSSLGDFFVNDPKGRQLPAYLEKLARVLVAEQQEMLNELGLLSGNIDHIKEIVAMQQNYATVSGVHETLALADLIEDAVRLNFESLERHEIKIRREYSPLPPVTIEKHKMLQILVNLIQNAKYAMSESGSQDKLLILRLEGAEGGGARVSVIDNGIGIPPENLTKIFAHGFTTRKGGHGFGLHSGALAAQQLGGSLIAQSEGLSKGAVFIVEIPASPARGSKKAPGPSSPLSTFTTPIEEMSAVRV
jgi:signal transduction histidine kinase